MAVEMRLSAASLSSGRIMPRPIWRSMLRPIASMPLSICAWSTSARRISNPLRAQTWAMPLPIWPAPMTPMRLIMLGTPGFRNSLLFDRGGQLVHDLEEVADDTIVGHLEDRRFFVLVDRHDGLAVLHAGEMLDRAGDADGNIKVGRHDLAGLADLVVVRHVAGIDRGAAGAELVGQRLEDLEVIAAAHAAAAGHHDLGRGELGPLALGQLGAHIRRQALAALAADLLDRGRIAPWALARRRLEVGRADGDDLDLVGALHRR